MIPDLVSIEVLYFFMMLAQLRNTSNDKIAGALRILLGLVFFMAGLLKAVVPHLDR